MQQCEQRGVRRRFHAARDGGIAAGDLLLPCAALTIEGDVRELCAQQIGHMVRLPQCELSDTAQRGARRQTVSIQRGGESAVTIRAQPACVAKELTALLRVPMTTRFGSAPVSMVGSADGDG